MPFLLSLLRKDVYMGRPKGTKDKSKRKRKTILDSKTERQLIKDYADGVAPYLIREKYNISTGALSTLLKNRNVKIRLNKNNISQWKLIKDINILEKNITGIYAILFEWSGENKKYEDDPAAYGFKLNDQKIYIGSSVCIKSRLASHLSQIDSGTHFNLELMKYASNDEYKMILYIIEECEEKELLQKEGNMVRSVGLSLINKNIAVDKKDIEPWLNKAMSHDSYTTNYYYDKNKSYNGSLCKCSKSIHKDGYGKFRVTVNGETKYLIKHRIAYWEKYRKYPELVRHLCNNRACYNPDHLAEGSCRDNNLDKRGDFPKEFETIWVKHQGDLKKISEYYSNRWSANQEWKGNKVSYSVYDWEKKLNLATKYPDIMKDRRNRATF